MKQSRIAIKSVAGIICLLLTLAISNEALAAKKKSKRKTKPTATAPKYVFNIPYASPEAAQAALEQRSDIPRHDAPPYGWETQENWKVFKEHTTGKPGVIEWAFTPPEHPAHPTAIKRYFDVGSADHIYIDTTMMCAGERTACKDLSGIVEKANWRIKKDNERHFVKEGEFLWKDAPTSHPISAKD